LASLPVFRSLATGAKAFPAAVQVRQACREAKHTGPTAGFGGNALQANLVVVPHQYAHDFMQFCLRNPGPCPVLDVSAPGCPLLKRTTVGPDYADVRTDLPKYRVFRNGTVMADEDGPTDVSKFWTKTGRGSELNLVSFALGCSFSWENMLKEMGPDYCPRHVENGTCVPMYRTSMPAESYGVFHGNIVVSMRPYQPRCVQAVSDLTRRFPAAHGAPMYVGPNFAKDLGILDLLKPDFGDIPEMREGDVPMFHFCGVTPQLALEAAKIPFAITHVPGHMLVLDAVTSDVDSFSGFSKL